jgi:8-oxo-dGTP diphosphatase
LAYVLSADRQQVLMIHRDARTDDEHYGKYNGLGGKLHRDENIVAGMQRELAEEGGIVAEQMALAGSISWPGFGRRGEDWFGFIFRVDRFRGTVSERNSEGTLRWVPIAHLPELPLWEGDRHFLPLVFAEPLRPFHGVMPYRDGRPLSWSYAYLDGAPVAEP